MYYLIDVFDELVANIREELVEHCVARASLSHSGGMTLVRPRTVSHCITLLLLLR